MLPNYSHLTKLYVCIVLSLASGQVNAFGFSVNTHLPACSATKTIQKTRSQTKTRRGTSLKEQAVAGSYTKGSEIFPPCNQKDFTLADSFPNGVIPPMAQSILEEKAPHLAQGMEITDQANDPSKRNLFLLASTAVAATASSQYLVKGSSTLPFSQKTARILDIPQAIQWIDDNCDRRFLHAVIASDYRFLYRGVSSLGPNDIRMENFGKSDLLKEGTYESPQALKVFESIQDVLENEVVNPANGHLATSSAKDAGEWGVAASIWPLNGAHYAWFQDGGLFYPRPNTDASVIKRDDIIVDGKDCGKESLEDALRSDWCEVMLSSNDVLVVPASLDGELREALKGSFLV